MSSVPLGNEADHGMPGFDKMFAKKERLAREKIEKLEQENREFRSKLLELETRQAEALEAIADIQNESKRTNKRKSKRKKKS